MLKDKTVSVIIPCRNEEKVIASVVRNIPHYIDEVIVVDNRSKDKTAEVARKAGAVVFKEKRAVKGIGYGFAHQTGLKNARGDYLAAMDGDGTYPASKIRNIISYMNKNELDFVSCNRLPLENKRAISLIRRLGINFLNWEIRLLYGYPIHDTLTGMWVFKKEILKKLNLREGGWDLSPEIKMAALADPTIKFGEYHIAHFVRNGALSKQVIWKTGVGHAFYIFKRRMTTDNTVFKYSGVIVRSLRSVWQNKAGITQNFTRKFAPFS
jgi:glycosyltransferase involved in cell wall biosynthesis